MTSKIKVDNINKVSDDSNIIKKCGTTTTIGSGASNPIVVDGSAVTLGRCGGTVALASGATQTGFGRTGTVDWQTGSIKTSTFTATSGEGYFCNTSGGAFTVNLPAGSAGAIVSLSDYTRTWQTNALTVSPNGSEKLGGVNANAILNTEGQSVTFVYVDATEGWINVQDSTSAVQGRLVTPYITATGGTITTSGDYKIHTFTGTGPFNVTNEGTPSGSNVVDYLVVAGGGGGGVSGAGGAGAGGGYRESPGTASGSYSVSPIAGGSALPVSFQDYTITVGAGGVGYNGIPVPDYGNGTNGSVSTFSSITSAGGGFGSSASDAGGPGGSGGGTADAGAAGGSGNTPPVSPPQGNNGGVGGPGAGGHDAGGGGGGATAVGVAGTQTPSSGTGGPGGAGATSAITTSSVARAGGGGGGKRNCGRPGNAGNGVDGGSNGVKGNDTASNATDNLGGGGGASSYNGGPYGKAGNGGSGIVVIRYKFQN